MNALRSPRPVQDRRSARHWGIAPYLAVATLSLVTVPAVALGQAAVQSLAMLDQLEAGQWQLHERNSTAPGRSICIRSGRELLQTHHSGQNCTRHVAQDTPRSVSVDYVCTGTGTGRTTIMRETNRLVQIETQGIERGAPFSEMLEARRTGPCT